MQKHGGKAHTTYSGKLIMSLEIFSIINRYGVTIFLILFCLPMSFYYF